MAYQSYRHADNKHQFGDYEVLARHGQPIEHVLSWLADQHHYLPSEIEYTDWLWSEENN